MTKWALILVMTLTVVYGCDSALSRWDKVSVTVKGDTSYTNPGTLVVNAGEDLLTNIAFERAVVVEGTGPFTYFWEGDGALEFGSPFTESTLITSTTDGTYAVSVTVRNEAGGEGSDDFQLVWDTTPPTPSNDLQTLAGGTGGPDVRLTKETTIAFSWARATDAIAGVQSYNLSWFDAANCTGQETVETGLSDPFFEVSGTHGDVFSYQVTAVDELGQEATTACSPSITIDTVAPPDLDGLVGNTGAQIGTTLLTLDIPADISDYAQVIVRRVVGATAPASCTDGSVAKTLTPAQLADPTSVTDVTIMAGQALSYLVCITDQAGNETAVDTVTNVTTKPHYVFVSSTAVNGALGGGVAAADTLCETLAAASTKGVINTDSSWRAILSTSTVNARDRIDVRGKILHADPGTDVLVANDENDLWDGSIANFIAYDEDQNSPVLSVWSGTLSNGTVGADTCSNWTDPTAGSSARVGNLGASNGDWINVAAPQTCNTTAQVYCISQF